MTIRQESMAPKAAAWVLVLALSVVLATGCGKKPQDSEVQPKWVILNEDREINTRGIAFVDSLNGWAINEYGIWTNAYYRTRDGGRTWDLGGIPSNPHSHVLLDLAFTDTLNGWLVGAGGVIYHTKDGGDSWTVDDRLYDAPGQPKIKKVFFHDWPNGWIGYGGSIARTTDGGENWEVVAEWGKHLLQALNKDVAFAEVFWDAKIHRTTNGGSTWHEIYSGTGNSLSRVLVSFVSEQEGWATISWEAEYTYGSFLIYTQNGGVSWDTLLNFEGRDMRDICMLPSREGWIYSYPPKTTLHTVDGLTWREDPFPDIGNRGVAYLTVLPGPHAWVIAGGLILKREGD